MIRRTRNRVRRFVLRWLLGKCALTSAGMHCASWTRHDGPHLFTNREWRRGRASQDVAP